MKVETAKQIAYCIPVIQQVLGAITIITGLARVIFDAIRTDLPKEIKIQSVKTDLRLMAKGVLIFLPLISTIFFLVVLLRKEGLFSKEMKKELRTLFELDASNVTKNNYQYSRGESTLTYSFWGVALAEDLLEKDPLFILDAIATGLDFNQTQTSSLVVKFVNENAFGEGPFKHFLTKLVPAAVSLLLDKGTKMPLTETDNVNNAKRLRVLGYLLRLAVINNYPMGCLFPAELFQMLIAIKRDERDLDFLEIYASSNHHQDVMESRLLFLLGLPIHLLTIKQWQEMAIGLIGINNDVIQDWPRDENNGLKLLTYAELKKLDLTKIRDAVAHIYTEGSEVEVKKGERWNGKKIQNFLFKKASEDKSFLEILKNVYAIAEGFYHSKTTGSPLVIKTNAIDLALQIEGESITADNIISFFDPYSAAPQKTKDYLQRWILEKKDEQKWLTQFVFATTGLKSLNAKMSEIQISSDSSRFSRISFATCFNNISINMDMIEEQAKKNNRDEYEFFKECLEDAVLNGQTDFSRG